MYGVCEWGGRGVGGGWVSLCGWGCECEKIINHARECINPHHHGPHLDLTSPNSSSYGGGNVAPKVDASHRYFVSTQAEQLKHASKNILFGG